MRRLTDSLLIPSIIILTLATILIGTGLFRPSAMHAAHPLDTPDMFLSIEDDELDWTTGEQIRVLAFSWSGKEMIMAPDAERAPELAHLNIDRPTLQIRKYEDQFSEKLEEARLNVVTLDAVEFTINWPGKVSLGYRLNNVKIVSMRTLATEKLATRPYEELVLVFDRIEVDTTGLKRN